MKLQTIESTILSNGRVEIWKRTGKDSGRTGKYSVNFFPADGGQPELLMGREKNEAYIIYTDIIRADMFERF